MRPIKAIATCAVTTMAMVFSVQQGANGPLVTYKLEVPKTVEAAEPPKAGVPLSAVTRDMDAVRLPDDVAPLQAIAPAEPKMSPLQPTALGTVTLPADRAAATAPRPAPQPAAVPLRVPNRQAIFQIVSDYDSDGEIMVNERTGERITLEAVNDEVRWRRETAQRLRNHPFAPRF
ncbi:hypothetical protein [Pelagibius marinus]|uniref:hypothetical protein n=1 Tax=Pelagibius marinus TaxID=2762760 RepID=UPI001872202B|nr:hypothetical protein [Pelagibius marinus]